MARQRNRPQGNRSRNRGRTIGVLVAVVALVAAGSVWLFTGNGKRIPVTAYFTQAVGLYPGSDVRVLGVAIGTVETVEPQGQQVKVTMTLEPDAPVPANASAVVVTPSLVSDRYVQLTPVAMTGPKIAADTVIPTARTAVPVELDQLFHSLDELTKALGPDGANKDGALSQFLNSAAANLDGNGAKIGESLRELGKAARTLGGSSDDLFVTIDSIQKFTSMLAANDQGVRVFNDQLAKITEFLAGQRDDFGTALRELSGALGTVQKFVQDNRGRIKSNVDKLAGTARVLADQKASLAEALDRAPKAMGSLLNAYDPATRTIDARSNLNEFSMVPR
ncbi:virulence factor Mce-like protein [Herbihabitans rhizosphaerae]|uniref:Virulence factor Mce-like protein n=1 Tax=Herbihabitans rhizosphaerae TaxID=1872711 RepID=A0A4Q7KC81_9PSEU|nr:MCE family protein [Herbihabitans rhizosphaerae]RZS29435.1 virulence factor Mce-like protein [Herbihabitans rhizosphaerae]